MSFQASVLTLFPELFPGPLSASLSGRALAAGLWRLEAIDIRAFAEGPHRSVDDAPYGGGAGMVLRPDIVDRALEAVGNDRPRICLTPRGRRLDQARVAALAAGPGIVLLAGRYEGIDQRVIEARGLEEVSIGDYVLSGGEIAAMVLLDAVVRLLPGVMGSEASAAEESFSGGLLEYPHYTRPAVWEGRAVPAVLLSGDHAAVAAWRRAEAERITRERRPDLLTEDARQFLAKDASAYHDAELTGVHMGRSDKALALTFAMSDGGSESLEFYDVLAYKFDNVTYQNVVSRLLVSSFGGIGRAELSRMFRWISSSREGDLLISEEVFSQYERDIFAGRLHLFYLDPSWGAEGGVVSGRICVSRPSRP